VGAWGEAIAARHLEGKGYRIRDRNWRAGRGELDIVAEREGAVVFVEVRARRSDAYGAPEETITPRKQAKLIETAERYLAEHSLEGAQWQIDAVVIEFDARNAVARLDHIECAVERAVERASVS
jgi:putative endonuclease